MLQIYKLFNIFYCGHYNTMICAVVVCLSVYLTVVCDQS